VQVSHVQSNSYLVTHPFVVVFITISVDDEFGALFLHFRASEFGSRVVVEWLVNWDVNEVIEVVRVGQDVVGVTSLDGALGIEAQALLSSFDLLLDAHTVLVLFLEHSETVIIHHLELIRSIDVEEVTALHFLVIGVSEIVHVKGLPVIGNVFIWVTISDFPEGEQLVKRVIEESVEAGNDEANPCHQEHRPGWGLPSV
jgi:hypothetical protein